MLKDFINLLADPITSFPLASGQTKNISETMLAVENAEIAFKTMNQVRMKVIEAYKEIMRMQM